MKQGKATFKLVAVSVVTVFISTLVMVDLLRCRQSEAAELGLPQPGTLLTAGVVHQAPIMKGVRFNPQDPLNLEFIFDSGSEKAVDQSQARQLIEYFIAGLLVPESDLWVNLSPYESERVVPQALGETALGRDMLATDYVLKQLASSLTHPDSETGKAYWNLKSEISDQDFSKVWVMPDAANMIDAETAGYIIDATLKVMTEADYTALQESGLRPSSLVPANEVSDRPSAMSALLPAITSDVNEGKNFETLRQIYHSLLLATWFKKKFMNTFYKQYFDSTGVDGVPSGDPDARKKIYDLYVSAFNKGAYDLYKKERNETGRVARRRFFSGGAVMSDLYRATRYQPVNKTTKSGFVRSIAGNSFACSAVVLNNVTAASAMVDSEDIHANIIYRELIQYIGAWFHMSTREEIVKVINDIKIPGTVKHLIVNDNFEGLKQTTDFGFSMAKPKDVIRIVIARTRNGEKDERIIYYARKNRNFFVYANPYKTKRVYWNSTTSTCENIIKELNYAVNSSRFNLAAIDKEKILDGLGQFFRNTSFRDFEDKNSGLKISGYGPFVIHVSYGDYDFYYDVRARKCFHDRELTSPKGGWIPGASSAVSAWVTDSLVGVGVCLSISALICAHAYIKSRTQVFDRMEKYLHDAAKVVRAQRMAKDVIVEVNRIIDHPRNEKRKLTIRDRAEIVDAVEKYFTHSLERENVRIFLQGIGDVEISEKERSVVRVSLGGESFFYNFVKRIVYAEVNNSIAYSKQWKPGASSAVAKNVVGGISLRETAEVKVAPYEGPLAVPVGITGAMRVLTLSELRSVAAWELL